MADMPNPFGDLTRMLEQFKVPGIDMTSIVEARRRDIEALVEVNKAAYEGMQALARKQTEMLTQAMQDLKDTAANVAGGGAKMPDPAKQVEVARDAFQKVVADMTELAEIARKSQVEVVATITRRATENMQEMHNLLRPK